MFSDNVEKWLIAKKNGLEKDLNRIRKKVLVHVLFAASSLNLDFLRMHFVTTV